MASSNTPEIEPENHIPTLALPAYVGPAASSTSGYRGFLPLAARRLAAKYLSCMQFICPHEALPFILLAAAWLVKIGLGTDRLRTVNKAAAGMAMVHLIFESLSKITQDEEG